MCDVCVIDAVKRQMMSRRDFFSASTAAVAAAAASAGYVAAAPQAMSAGHDSVVDMTHVYDENFPTFSGLPGIGIEQQYSFAEFGFNAFQLELSEHTGTHIDAPLHFTADGQAVNEIPISNLVCPLAVVDIAAKAETDADAQVTPDDLRSWIVANGEFPEGACIAMHSGWAAKAGGNAFRNADADGVMHFPGFHVEATQMLVEETGAVAMAVDTLSLDHGPSTDFATHYVWLGMNRYGIECIAGLDKVPATGATLVVGAPNHRGGSGGPARIFAMM